MRHALALPFAAVAVLLAAPGAARADEPRTVDFLGGFTYVAEPLHDGFTTAPGVDLAVRWLSPRGFWLRGEAGYAPSVDLRNPERGSLAHIATLGGGAGLWWHAGPLSLHAGGRVDLVATDTDDPSRLVIQIVPSPEDDRLIAGAYLGYRTGPVASLALTVGHAFGHPMMLELEAAWWRTSMPEGWSTSGFAGGLYLTGVLFPDR